MHRRQWTQFEIPSEFEPHVAAVLTRLQYLRPELRIVQDPAGLVVELVDGVATDDLRREIFHLLYREKVYQDTLPLRRSLYEALVR